jgi:mono/diheme cytochrome c family protein
VRTSTARAAVLLACALLPGAGCVDDLRPDIGPPVQELCLDEDSDPDTPVRFGRDIVEVLFARELTGCHQCHRPTAPTPLGFEVGGLDLTSATSLRGGGVVSGSDIVIPGRPCDSIIVQKISPAPPFGGRMPLNGPPFLTDEERQLIHDWVAEGALDN